MAIRLQYIRRMPRFQALLCFVLALACHAETFTAEIDHVIDGDTIALREVLRGSSECSPLESIVCPHMASVRSGQRELVLARPQLGNSKRCSESLVITARISGSSFSTGLIASIFL